MCLFVLVCVASTHSSVSGKTESDQSNVACTCSACHGLNVSGRNALRLKTGSIRMWWAGNRSISSSGGMTISSDLCGLLLNERSSWALWSGSKSVAWERLGRYELGEGSQGFRIQRRGQYNWPVDHLSLLAGVTSAWIIEVYWGWGLGQCSRASEKFWIP